MDVNSLEAFLVLLAQLARGISLLALMTGVVIMLLVGPRTRHHWSCLYLFASWTVLSVVSYYSNMQGPTPTVAPLWVRAPMWVMVGSSCIIFIITSWQEWIHTAWECRKPDAPSDVCGK